VTRDPFLLGMDVMPPRRLLEAQTRSYVRVIDEATWRTAKEEIMKKELTLPRPVEHYLRTVNAGDADAFFEVFADDAVVHDLNREIRGMDAIKKWARKDIFAVHARFDVTDASESGGRTILTVKIDGTFDKKGLPDPLLMDHAFAVEGGKITELVVTFTPDELA
jgi:ketosteroid isomerase-like protein